MSQARAHLESALAGQQAALVALAEALTPIIQARVARSLLRRSDLSAYDVRQEVEDLCQEIFVALFADDARILRAWDPERGLSLENFVGFVAERQLASILRTGKRNPWQEDPTLTEELDQADPDAGPHETAASRDVLRRLLRRLEEELSPLGRQLFDLLYLQERTVPEVEAATGMGSDGVYAWRSRLRKLARKLFAEIEAGTGRSRSRAS